MSQWFDYVIVGSGIAGLYTALLAKEYGSVIILTKGSIEDCNTRYAQGGIAAAVGEGDSPELHKHDTVDAGAGLCDVEAVDILAQEAPNRIADLTRMGVVFDTVDADVSLAREGAHSVARVLHAGGDSTGSHIELTLVGLARSSRVEVREHCLAQEIIVEEGIATGVRVLNHRDNYTEEVHGKFVVLATGGAGKLFKYTTNSDVATGEGVALAFEAGASVMDMEFFQFHPTALHLRNVQPFLISEAVRGEGGILRNINGDPFMREFHELGDLAPRDVVSRAIVDQIKKYDSGHVLLDVTHLNPSKIASRFPTIYRFCLKNGLDINKDLIPVAPAAHYMMGGVKTNTCAQTTISGLYACGECAAGAVHGANRLASNSLIETLVFGKRLVEHTRGFRHHDGAPVKDVVSNLRRRELLSSRVPKLTMESLQNLMWDKVGIVRDGDSLSIALGTLNAWTDKSYLIKNGIDWQLSKMALVGRLIAESSFLREESRGAHYRSDFQTPNRFWEKHMVLRNGGDDA